MLQYILKRILMTVPTMIIVAVMIFVLIRLIPGDPAVVMLGDIDDATLLEETRQAMGLYDPIVVQFATWVGKVSQGDLGVSLMTGENVLSALLERFAVTAQVILLSVLIAVAIAVPAGMLAAWRQNKPTDFIIVFLIILSLSVPSFWIGIMLILVFGVGLDWFPTLGFVSVFEGGPEAIKYLVLPVAALVFGEMATVTRMARSSTIEVLRLEYITHARAKGLKESTIMFRHAFPNAFAPTLTIIGLLLGGLLGGAAVIETVFTLPGLGRFLVEGIYARDYPVVQGTLLLVALIYVVTNLLVDLLYPIFDPRVKL